MRYLFPAVLGLALLTAKAEDNRPEATCWGVPVRPESIPVLTKRPSLTASITPQVRTTPGTMEFKVTLDRGEGAYFPERPYVHLKRELRLPKLDSQESAYMDQDIWRKEEAINEDGQGLYTLRATALYCYRTCNDLNNPSCGKVHGDTLRGEARGAVYIPRESANLRTLMLLIEADYREGEGERRIFALAKDLHPALKDLLGRTARGEWTDCDFFGICRALYPFIQRFLSDVVDNFRSLVATDWLRGGPGGVHYEARRDSRAYDIGPNVEVALLIFEGTRHDFIAVGEGLVDGENPIILIEAPKGLGRILRQAIQLSILERQSREVR